METLEKLRNGIDQLPKWLLLVLVIFVDGLVGGLYRAAGKTTAARVIGWIMAAAYVLSILSFVELPATLATVSRIVTVVSGRRYHHRHHQRQDHVLCRLRKERNKKTFRSPVMKLFTIILFAVTYILMIALPKKAALCRAHLRRHLRRLRCDAAGLRLYRHRLERSFDACRYDGHGRAVH